MLSTQICADGNSLTPNLLLALFKFNDQNYLSKEHTSFFEDKISLE
jgi:hypothetical protein